MTLDKMAASLFGHGGAGRSSNKNLVEFRAGKMKLNGKTVTADKRKGLVYIYQSADSLMHFCWKDRTSGSIEDDLIIFPDDVEYKHVKQCTTGRVFILKFKSSTRKFFFWMQEPKTDKDDDYCTKVNHYLNNPPAPGSSGEGGLPPGLAGLGEQIAGDSQLQGLLGNMDQQQLMQLLGGYGLGNLGSGLGSRNSDAPAASSPTPSRVQSSPAARPRSTPANASEASTPRASTTTPSAPSAPPAAPSIPRTQAVQLSDLQDILSNLQVPTEHGEQAQRSESVDLSRAISPEDLTPILNNPDLRQQLAQFLPDGEQLPQTPDEVASTLKSPQFQQALAMFSSALQSGQLGPLMQQFGFGSDVAQAAARGDMVEFARAVQESSRPSTADSTSGTADSRPPTAGIDKKEDGDKKDKDDDEPMALD